MINPSEPVRLRNAHGDVRGKVVEIGTDGMLTVDWANGIRGHYLPKDLEPATHPAENKTWPPAGLETKTPRVEVK